MILYEVGICAAGPLHRWPTIRALIGSLCSRRRDIVDDSSRPRSPTRTSSPQTRTRMMTVAILTPKVASMSTSGLESTSRPVTFARPSMYSMVARMSHLSEPQSKAQPSTVEGSTCVTRALVSAKLQRTTLVGRAATRGPSMAFRAYRTGQRLQAFQTENWERANSPAIRRRPGVRSTRRRFTMAATRTTTSTSSTRVERWKSRGTLSS